MEKASTKPQLAWSKWAAILEMEVFAIEVTNLLRVKPQLVEPAEFIYEIEISAETEAQKKNREVRNQKKTSWLGKQSPEGKRERRTKKFFSVGRS